MYEFFVTSIDVPSQHNVTCYDLVVSGSFHWRLPEARRFVAGPLLCDGTRIHTFHVNIIWCVVEFTL